MSRERGVSAGVAGGCVIDGFTALPRCRRCGGAFYPHPDYARWDHDYCADCWEIVADASALRAAIERGKFEVCLVRSE